MAAQGENEIGMVGANRLFFNLQGAFIERFRQGILTLVTVYIGEICECLGYIGMIGPSVFSWIARIRFKKNTEQSGIAR